MSNIFIGQNSKSKRFFEASVIFVRSLERETLSSGCLFVLNIDIFRMVLNKTFTNLNPILLI